MDFAATVYVTANGVASKPVVKSRITARREKYFFYINHFDCLPKILIIYDLIKVGLA